MTICMPFAEYPDRNGVINGSVLPMTRNIQIEGYDGHSAGGYSICLADLSLPVETLSFTKRLYKRNLQFSSEFEGSISHIEFMAEWYTPKLGEYPVSIEELARRLHGYKHKNEFIRFYVTLELYDRLDCSPLFSKEEIWKKSLFLGPSYATWLADAYTYAYRNTYGIGYACPDSEFAQLRIENYSQIFSHRFLPRFEEETNDMAEWMTTPPEYHDATVRMVILEFESLLRSIPYIEVPDVESVLNTFKPTITYVNGVKRRPYELSVDEHRRIDVTYVGYEAKVQVYPGGMRDTVILEKGSSNAVRIAERLLLAVISHCRESIYTIGGDRIQSFKRDFSEMRGLHVLRDIKKCGLTAPISLYIDAFVRLLQAYFPHDDWNYIYIYKHISIILQDGTTLHPKRGFGLGMANAFVTLLCILIHRIAKREICRKYPYIAVHAAIGNDDSNVMIIGGDKVVAYDYCQIECDVMTHAGFVINYKKNYIAETYHFFEEYGNPNFQKKEVLSVGLLAKGLLEQNPRVAKMFVREAVRICPSDKIIELARAIANTREPEFDDSECERPYLLGGWFDFKPHIYVKGLECGEYLHCYDPSKCYRALKVIKAFEQIDRLQCDDEITSPDDNSNPIYRALKYTGEAVKGVVGYYNVSVKGLYNSLQKTWKLRNRPKYAYHIYKNILNRTKLRNVTPDELVAFATSTNCFSTPMVRGLGKGTTVMSTFIYEVPRFINLSPSNVSAINKHLADLIEMDPHLPHPDDEYGYQNYTFVKTLMTDKDPRGLRAFDEDIVYIGANEKVIYPETLSWSDIQYVIDRLEELKAIVVRVRQPINYVPLSMAEGDLWRLGDDPHPLNEDYLESRAFKVRFLKEPSSETESVSSYEYDEEVSYPEPEDIRDIFLRNYDKRRRVVQEPCTEVVDNVHSLCSQSNSSYYYSDEEEQIIFTDEDYASDVEEYIYYLRSQESSANEDDNYHTDVSEINYECLMDKLIGHDFPLSKANVTNFLKLDTNERMRLVRTKYMSWIDDVPRAIRDRVNRVCIIDSEDSCEAPDITDLREIKAFFKEQELLDEESEELSEVSFAFTSGGSYDEESSYESSDDSDAE